MIEMNKSVQSLHADSNTGLFIYEAVQNGLPTRPEVKSSPQAYPQGYVEDADEPRNEVGGRFQQPHLVRVSSSLGGVA
jgi:hypothetical protein